MKNHIVTRDEIEQAIIQAEVRLAQSSNSSGLAKGLYWYPAERLYKVWVNGEVTLRTMWLDWAMDEYNKH